MKKDIQKKRELLEKELKVEIQMELETELVATRRTERIKQEDNRSMTTTAITGTPATAGKDGKRKAAKNNLAVVATSASNTPVSTKGKPHKPKKGPRSGPSKKKEKLYCLCQTPYDDSK